MSGWDREIGRDLGIKWGAKDDIGERSAKIAGSLRDATEGIHRSLQSKTDSAVQWLRQMTP